MLKFIELHAKDDKALLSINIENIVGFGVDDGAAVIRTIDKGGWFVAESYEEIKQLIHDVGVLIHKPDPRLNLTKPLTLEDLKYMEGEPVWNSNSGEWGLVTKDPEWRGELQDGYYFRHHDGTITMLWDEGLIRYPLYRMHQ